MVQFYAPVQALAQLTDVFQSTAVSAERVFGIMDTPREVADAENAQPLERARGHVVFENVDFSYEKGERVLRDFSLEVQPGEIIGLVGQTGSGKSTVVKLLARFYDPDRGRIILDGKELRRIRLRDLRAQMGMVLQETFLFTGSLRENIAYGRPEATSEEIIEAARAANAHEFIMEMPDAYDTYVGERGVGLSGGERQRIAIARAILKNPRILILDEATASVDTETEEKIQQALRRLIAGRTTFAIAHRLSTLKYANRLLVLDHGELVESGTHEELVELGGTYASLCEKQSKLSSLTAWSE
jgi:ATP-binding cassette subfamily B protein